MFLNKDESSSAVYSHYRPYMSDFTASQNNNKFNWMSVKLLFWKPRLQQQDNKVVSN